MVIKGHFLLLLMAFTVRGEMISLSPADADTKIAPGFAASPPLPGSLPQADQSYFASPNPSPNPQSSQKKLSRGVCAGYFDIIVDVRNCQEFDQGHISGALNLKGTSAVQQLAGCEDKKIGVYCWTGPDR